MLDATEIAPISKVALADEVCARIEILILNGTLKQGKRINESKLSALLQVSRSPIREACRKLESLGLIESIANRGSFVREILQDEAFELYDIRGELEAFGGRQACAMAEDKELDRLGTYMDDMRDAAQSEELSRYFDLNLDFHTHVVELARNQSLLDMYVVIRKKLSLYQMATLAAPRGMQISVEQHSRIAEAVQRRDANAAAEACRAHAASAKQRAGESVTTLEDD